MPEKQLTIEERPDDDAETVVEPDTDLELAEAEVVDEAEAAEKADELLQTYSEPTTTIAPVATLDPGPALMQIIQDAVAADKAVDVIERLLDVQERWQAGEARKLYNAAMAKLRGELPAVVKTEEVDYKTSKGPVYYRHENLARMIEDLSPVMAKFGLSFRWKIDDSVPQSIHVTCIVTHEAGHSEETTLAGPPDNTGSKNAIQAIASTVSYLQRYTLKAAIGLAAGKDDDGDGGAPLEQPRANGESTDAAPGDSSEISELHEARSLFPTDQSKTISSNQQGRLYNLAKKNGWTNAGVDETIAQRLSLQTSEIPSVGDAYESIVRWFQTNKPS